MDRTVIDAVSSVLGSALVTPKNVRDALFACLDLVPAHDEDAGVLRLILEDEPRYEALDEFRLTFAEIRSRAVPRKT